MTYIRFSEHTFRLDPPDAFQELAFNRDADLIEETWYVEKPVSCVWREPGSEDIENLKELFNVHIDDSVEIDGCVPVYFSRLPELPEVTANLETAVDGILFGFPGRDVASFIAQSNDEHISCETIK